MAKDDTPKDIKLEIDIPFNAPGPVKATIRHGTGRPVPVATSPPPRQTKGKSA